jgi:hypothetical protein
MHDGSDGDWSTGAWFTDLTVQQTQRGGAPIAYVLLVAPLRHMCDICGGADLQLAKIAVKMLFVTCVSRPHARLKSKHDFLSTCYCLRFSFSRINGMGDSGHEATICRMDRRYLP